MHQYSEEFEREVRIWTGPLICENESNLEGMSKIITCLTDKLCPSATSKLGMKIPICPTTFSGDQKTEKASRSAQIAQIDNGSMIDKLRFIEGRHELLHFLFMVTDVILDLFADKENLEESACLSRLIKLLNPKLENKKGKDAFYAFRDVYNDVFVAQVGESFRKFLKVASLDEDITPNDIKLEPDPTKKMKSLRALMRKFIRHSHEDFKSCAATGPGEQPLPPFYPHEKFVRKSKKSVQVNLYNPVQLEVSKNLANEKPNKPAKIDFKNEYFRALFSFLGMYHLLLDSIKEGNAQKANAKITQTVNTLD